MGTEMIVMLLVWTVTGLLAAVVFGRMIQKSDTDREEETILASSDAVEYLRRNKRKLQNRTQHGANTAKRAVG